MRVGSDEAPSTATERGANKGVRPEKRLDMTDLSQLIAMDCLREPMRWVQSGAAVIERQPIGQSLVPVVGRGFRPGPGPRGSASWNSAKGSGPWNPLMGLFSGEGQPRPCKVRVGPPLRTNPIDRSQRASPFAGDPRGKAPGGFQGGALTLQPARTIAPTRSP